MARLIPDDSHRVASDSISVAAWTAISRGTGFLRVVAIAAVLGPTYLGNTFLALNLLPNLIFALLSGSLINALLVPSLVRKLDSGDDAAADRLAAGFLGIGLLGFTAAAAVVVAGGPLVIGLLAVAVDNPAIAEEQLRVGWPLMAMLMPQIPLYAIAAVSAAAMNARGEFRLPAAAPALENIGIIATVGTVAVVFGTGTPISDVSTGQLLVLGLGATAAVALNAGTQWWGAHNAGARLRPQLAWRDREVRAILARGRSSLGHAGLDALRLFGILIAANSIAGGVIAFGLALNFFQLPLALGAAPVAIAFLPRFARLSGMGDFMGFREEYIRGTGIAFFLTVPAAIAYLVLSVPLAKAAAWGEMADSNGVTLLGAALAALAIGLLGEARFLMSTNASYALGDARAPFVAMLLRTIVSLAGVIVATRLGSDVAVVLLLGASVTVGNLVGAWHLGQHLAQRLPTSRSTFVLPGRSLAASLLMIAPAYLVAVGLDGLLDGEFGQVIAIVAAGILGAAIFLALGRRWESPEMSFFMGGFRMLRHRRTPS